MVFCVIDLMMLDLPTAFESSDKRVSAFEIRSEIIFLFRKLSKIVPGHFHLLWSEALFFKPLYKFLISQVFHGQLIIMHFNTYLEINSAALGSLTLLRILLV